MFTNFKVKSIRKNWAKSDAKRDFGLTTPDEIKRYDNISYGPYGTDNLLDIYIRKDATGLQPAIVNVHGGAWVYGSKEVYQFYCMQLALSGFAVVNINYRLAPENVFPAAIIDINTVMEFIEKHGCEYNIDKDRIVMVGDSAGGQLVSHYAAYATNSEFAKMLKLSIPNITIRALGLNCGIYDSKEMAMGKKDDMFLAYLGKGKRIRDEKLLGMVDTIGNITAKFPPSFVMSAQEDFLLSKAEPMYQKLQSMGVPSVVKIYGEKGNKEIGHVFHVNIKLDEATRCNNDEIEFFRKYV